VKMAAEPMEIDDSLYRSVEYQFSIVC